MKVKTKIAKLLYNLRHRDVPRIDTKNPDSKASNGQDVFVAEQLPEAGNRIFVEIGGNDGLTLSNTWYLEKRIGWRGISIEPLPRAFSELQKNRDCTTFNGCVADYDGETDFLAISGGPEMLSGIPGKYDARHMRRVRKNLKRQKASSREITVPCRRLDTLLRQHNIKHVDYLSIDTEGGELEILKSIDLYAIPVEMISVENNYFSTDIENYLLGQGYRLVGIAGLDEMYRKIS